MFVSALSNFCIRHGLIQADDLPMLRYCIEKRFYSAVVFLPLFVLGCIWTNLVTTVAFLGAFSYLRSTTNGFHAESPATCFICSVLIEFVLFVYILPHITTGIAIITLIISTVIIFAMAPFNHPNMGMTAKEICACRKLSKRRLIFLFLVFLISLALSWTDATAGLILGIALVAVLLCLAYIFN